MENQRFDQRADAAKDKHPNNKLAAVDLAATSGSQPRMRYRYDR